MKTKVVTYQSPNGGTINITPAQGRALRALGQWPRDTRGSEYCMVSHGMHYGAPSCDTIEELLTPRNERD